MPVCLENGKNLLFENVNRKVWNERDEAKDNSPYHLAENIKVPVLLIGSERDTVVEVKHSRKIYKRLRELKTPVTYVELPDDEHWRTKEANEIT